MGVGIAAAFLLACSLSIGPLISTSQHATSKALGNVRATLHWTDELRWQRPDDGGARFKATLIGAAYVRIAAPGIATQTLSLAPFLRRGHAYTPVDGPHDGCGAATDLAILRSNRQRLPYVVAFVVHAEKGCLALPIVFVPVKQRDGGLTYVAAPYFTIWSSQPQAQSRFRAASVDTVSLPSAIIEGLPSHWAVVVATNALPAGPRAATFMPPDPPKHIRVGSTIMLGDDYSAWFTQ